MLDGLKNLALGGTTPLPSSTIKTSKSAQEPSEEALELQRKLLKSKNVEINQLREKIKLADFDLNAVRRELGLTEQQLKAEQDKYKRLEQELVSAKASKMKATTKVKNQASTLSSQNKLIKILKEDLESAEQERDKFKQKHEAALETSKSHQRGAQQSAAEKKLVQSELEQSTQACKALQSKLEAVNASFMKLNTSHQQALKNLKNTHQQALNRAHEATHAAQQALAEKEVEALSLQIQQISLDHKKSLEKLTTEIANLKSSLAAKQHIISQLTHPQDGCSNPGFRKIDTQAKQPVEDITSNLLAQEQKCLSKHLSQFIIPDELKTQLDPVQNLMRLLNQADDMSSPGHRTYIDGGFPRAILAGMHFNDIDLITTRTTDWILSKGGRIGQFYFVQINPNVPHLFRDVQRKIDLVCHPNMDLIKDAYQRDLTGSALFLDENFNLLDPTGLGYDHIVNKHLAFIGDPIQRLEEDRSRALRLFRLSCEYGWPLDSELLELIAYYSGQLNQVPYGVFANNIRLLLATPNGMQACLQVGILGKLMQSPDFDKQLQFHPFILNFWQDVLSNPSQYKSDACRYTDPIALLLTLPAICLPAAIPVEKFVNDFLNHWSDKKFGDSNYRNVQHYNLCNNIRYYQKKFAEFLALKQDEVAQLQQIRTLSADAGAYLSQPVMQPSPQPITHLFNSEFPPLERGVQHHNRGWETKKRSAPRHPQ